MVQDAVTKYCQRWKKDIPLPLEYYSEVLDKHLEGRDPVEFTPQDKAAINFAEAISKHQTTDEEFCECPFSLSGPISIHG